jgi:tetratricopeptide (TPR) repeat protein
MNNTVDPEFISRYQKIFDTDPDSKVFAPLAEAYRKLGKIDNAFKICRRGIAKHPNFASGHVAMSRIYIDQQRNNEALEHLKKAISLAPENILAHSLMADLWLELRKPKEALKSFKMVLLLNPKDSHAQKSVEKLESLTADEYDEETFLMGRISDINDLVLAPKQSNSNNSNTTADQIRGIERVLTLADALLIRNEFDRATETLTRARATFGPNPEIDQRLLLIQQRDSNPEAHLAKGPDNAESLDPLPSPKIRLRLKKVKILETLLHKLNRLEIKHSI